MINLLEKTPYPIIVLEGPDGAGKTSLARSLQAAIGARYLHLTYRFRDRMHLYHTAAIRICARWAQEQPVILDRWWPSEIVYADAYRGGSKFTKHYFLLEHVANYAGAVYVMCLPEERERYLDHYAELKTQREEMYDEGLERVYDGYRWLYDGYLALKENVCHYDMFKNYSNHEAVKQASLALVSQRILEFAEDYRSTVA